MKPTGQTPLVTFLWVLVGAGSILVAIALVIALGVTVFSRYGSYRAPGGQMDLPVTIAVDARAANITAPSLGIDRAELRQVSGSLVFPPPRKMVAPTLLGLMAMLATVLWVLTELRGLLRTLRDGRPFVPANARRVRWIGIAVIVGALLRSMAEYGGSYFAATHFTAQGLTFETRAHLDFFGIVCGLIILAIAEVFRAGTRLEEEQSLTV